MDLKNVKKIGINIKPADTRVLELAQQLIEYLLQHSKEVLLDSKLSCSELTKKSLVYNTNQLAAEAELLIALGGDGTLLNAARSIAGKKTPLIGINLGRLGFLVEITPQKMTQHLDAIFNNRYRLEERIMLCAQYFRNGKQRAEHAICNDIVVKQYASGRMIELATAIDGIPVGQMSADGLIVSTPTGSTAYALSSGGPLVEPTLEAVLLVPICPHTLSHRPLIVDSNKDIQIEHIPHNQESALSSIDGQIDILMEPGDQILIKKIKQKLNLLQPQSHDYFQTLRTKLRWSETL